MNSKMRVIAALTFVAICLDLSTASRRRFDGYVPKTSSRSKYVANRKKIKLL